MHSDKISVQKKSEDIFQFLPWHCPICKNSTEKYLGVRGGNSHRHHLGVEAKIVQCESCGLLFPNPFPVPQSLQSIYTDPETYFGLHDMSEKVEASKGIVESAKERLKKSKLKVLDIGAGRGEFVHAATMLGCEVLGLELSLAMIESAQANYKISLVNESAEKHASLHPANYDLICMNSVLEHVHDPDSMMAAASTLLNAEGLLYLELPNEPNLLTRVGNTFNFLLGKNAVFNLSPTWPPYHVYGFNRRSLSKLLSKYDLELRELKIYSGHQIFSDGSFRDSIKCFLANRINDLGNLTGTASNMTVWIQKSRK